MARPPAASTLGALLVAVCTVGMLATTVLPAAAAPLVSDVTQALASPGSRDELL